MYDNRRDPVKGWNSKTVFFSSTYDQFGNGYDKHKKYLPCIGRIDKLAGDAFYEFTLFTKDGPIKSCGYTWFDPIDSVEKKYRLVQWIQFDELVSILQKAGLNITEDEPNVFVAR